MPERGSRRLRSPARRQLMLAAGGTLALALAPADLAFAARLMAVRVWPARDYTRVTLEHDDAALRFSHFVVRETPPLRMVVDIEGLALTATLKELVGKVAPNDPHIAAIRLAQHRPGVVRLVLDLKEDIRPQVFELEPAGPYRNRLVLDLYPAAPPDPLMALVRERELPPVPGDNAVAPATTTRTPRARRDAEALRRTVTVAIDAGHGGEDPGAIGSGGTYEKTVTLAIARRLREHLEAGATLRVLMTRDGDWFVPLGTRVQKARAVQADLFVSIHADAWIRPDARGSSVFALSESGASSTAAAWMARRENEADLIGGVNLGSHDRQVARVLLDLSTTAQINDSLKFGTAVLQELERVNRLHKPRVEQAGFAVLKAPDIPSILVETAFISNPEEEARLRDDAYQDQIAQAIAAGIGRHFAKFPPRPRGPLT